MASTPEEVTARLNELAMEIADLDRRIDQLEERLERRIDAHGELIDSVERSISRHKREEH